MLSEKEKHELNVVVQHPWEGENHPFYRKYELKPGRIAGQLDEEVNYWCSQNPVLINTPPGSGKTSFVYAVLLPRALQQGKNLLLISNRVALSSQQKSEIMKIVDDPRRGLLTAKGVQATEDFGAVRVLTYHRLPALLQDPRSQSWIAQLGYVVLDEAHFFVADAVFNEKCDYLLNMTTSSFCHAIRVYMTGTADDLMIPLAEAELKNYRKKPLRIPERLARECYHYHSTANYENYDLKFFRELGDLVPAIRLKTDEKWLVFVDSKDRGRDFAKQLGSGALYLDAGDKGDRQWEMLLESGMLPKQVLVTTAVLDCGVNIFDSSVRNIAIMADSKMAALQMLGRRRLVGKERICLFIREPSKGVISRRCAQMSEWLRWYDELDACYEEEQRQRLASMIWSNEDPQLRKLFRLWKGRVYPNQLARYMLRRKRALFEKILSGEVEFECVVESWLGIVGEGVESDITEEDLKKFCDENYGRAIKECGQDELRFLVDRLCRKYGKTQKAGRAERNTVTTLNKRLGELGTGLKIVSDDEGWWLLKRTEGK